MSSGHTCSKRFPQGLTVSHIKNDICNKKGHWKTMSFTKLINKETKEVVATIHGSNSTQNSTALAIKKAVDVAISEETK